MRIVVTGGAGFIGTNFLFLMHEKYPGYHIRVLDALTYSGNKDNLLSLLESPGIEFIRGDIREPDTCMEAVEGMDGVVNFAAESHVDRSIHDASDFLSTNIAGTYNMLKAAKERNVERFLHISTDEVYGSVESGSSKEDDPLLPASPYSASKASADLLVHSFGMTFGYRAMITRSSNNFGPYQYPEKLIPFFISNIMEGKKVPLYGDGLNVRDWIFVKDNCEALDAVFHKGTPGRIYNVGGGCEKTNMEITRCLLEYFGKDDSFIEFVKDRPGHDRRYSLDSTRITEELGWRPEHKFEDALTATIEWYIDNRPWWEAIKKKREEYISFMEKHYDSLSLKK